MTTETTNQPTNQPENTAETGGLFWVYIETAAGLIKAIGPYPTRRAADHALMHAPLIDGLCEEDAVDAWTNDLQPAPDAVRGLIDPMDPLHTGAGYGCTDNEATAVAALGVLLLLAALAATRSDA
ncbi:MAG: hypothetical protein REI45_14010 [Propionicimonas sp.]|nr:hypothetical protein [Propionicimonas sp.]